MAQDAPPAFVDAIDDATVFSRAAGGATSAELTMSWAGQSFAATGGALGEGELPPEYSQARAPTRPLQYTFTPHTSGSMLLIPPAEAPDSRAVYYITVFPNLFNPGTGVTRVLRGGGADGSFVGEFEWGLSRADLTLTIGSVQLEQRRVFLTTRAGSDEHTFRWTWSNQHPALYWKLDAHLCTCYRVRDGAQPRLWLPQVGRDTPLAVFTGRPLRARADLHPHPHPTLMVYPGAHEGTLLDHVMLSALMIERQRLVP